MSEPFFRPWAEIRAGEQAELTVTMDDARVRAFSALIGDTDSFHVSDEAAARTVFQTRICHGVHLLAYVSVTMLYINDWRGCLLLSLSFYRVC